MIQNLYNKTIDIIRIVRATDSMGGFTETESVLHNNLPCRINWSKGSEKIMFDKITYYRDAKLYCSVVDITTKDRIRYNSQDYEIVGLSDVDEVGKFLTIEIRRIE